MGMGRKLGTSAVALSSAALGFGGGVGTAGADEYSHGVRLPRSYISTTGQEVFCEVVGASFLSNPEGPPFFASMVTFAGDSESMRRECSSSITVFMRWIDGNGAQLTSAVSGDNHVDWQGENVAGQFFAQHFVTFHDCIDRCQVTFETHPK